MFHITQDIRVSVILTTFLAISPDPLDRFCSHQRQYCRQQNFLKCWSSSFFLYLSYFSRFSQKTSQAPQFDHFLTISPDPMGRFCSSSNLASQIKIEVFLKKIHQNRFRFTRVIVMTDRRTDRQTDRRTENFFFSFFAFLGLDRRPPLT